ncbi:MAG: UbiD family decarboxylase [Desulfuromusa sp.]
MDLGTYLEQLTQLDRLTIIRSPVATELELAALCRREFAKDGGGKALLFEKPGHSAFSVAANLFGAEQRASRLLHSSSYREFEKKLQTFLQQRSGSSTERLSVVGEREELVPNEQTELQFRPDLTLTDLPAIQSWPGEGGGYLTLALALTEDLETGAKNLGLYRVQIIDSNHLAVNFSPTSGAENHLTKVKKLNQPLPITLILGSDPALIWLASAPLPQQCDEFLFYRTFFKQQQQFTAGLSQPLSVPADAEMIIEGQILPRKTVTEGPFGNHTGQYVTRSDCPVMQVTAIRKQAKAIIPMTVVGPPPSENIYLAKASEILLREMLKIDYPQLSNLQMPLETIFHGVALLAVKPQSMAKNRDLIDSLWKDSPLSRSKLLVLLDEDIDLASASSCWWRTINRLQQQKIYQDSGRIAIDATGVDPENLVMEDRQTGELLHRRRPDEGDVV